MNMFEENLQRLYITDTRDQYKLKRLTALIKISKFITCKLTVNCGMLLFLVHLYCKYIITSFVKP